MLTIYTAEVALRWRPHKAKNKLLQLQPSGLVHYDLQSGRSQVLCAMDSLTVLDGQIGQVIVLHVELIC